MRYNKKFLAACRMMKAEGLVVVREAAIQANQALDIVEKKVAISDAIGAMYFWKARTLPSPTATISLRYFARDWDETKARSIGDIVHRALLAQGIGCDWTGDIRDCIELLAKDVYDFLG